MSAEGAPGRPALPVRAGLVFTAPGRLFDELRERPAWIDVLLLIVGLSLVGTFFIPKEAYLATFLGQAPADAPAEAVQQQAEFFYGLRYVFAAVAPPVVVTIIAGFLLFVFNVILGGEARFIQLFSATAHAFLITSVGGLLTIPIIRATGDLQSALSLNLLLPGLEEGFLYRLLHGMNVFGLWTAVVLGIAVSRLYPKREAGGAIGTVLGLYLAVKLLGALMGGLTA